MSDLATPVQLGRRREYLVSVLSTPSLVYTVVPAEEPNEHGFSEIAWANVGEIRLWRAMMFSLVTDIR